MVSCHRLPVSRMKKLVMSLFGMTVGCKGRTAAVVRTAAHNDVHCSVRGEDCAVLDSIPGPAHKGPCSGRLLEDMQIIVSLLSWQLTSSLLLASHGTKSWRRRLDVGVTWTY